MFSPSFSSSPSSTPNMLLTSFPLSLALPLFFNPALTFGQGQNSSSPSNPSYAAQFISALQSAGFTGLADALTTVNGTPAATELLSQLSSGKNFTVFAPNNQAGTSRVALDLELRIHLVVSSEPNPILGLQQCILARRVYQLPLRRRRFHQ